MCHVTRSFPPATSHHVASPTPTAATVAAAAANANHANNNNNNADNAAADARCRPGCPQQQGRGQWPAHQVGAPPPRADDGHGDELGGGDDELGTDGNGEQ